MSTVTMKQIAEALGLSKGTVSLSLRNDVRISEETRARVKQKALELGYRRDPALAALAESRWRGKSGTALVNMGFMQKAEKPEQLLDTMDFRYCRDFAEEKGYALIPLCFGENANVRSLNRQLENQSIRGVIVHEREFSEKSPWKEVNWDLASWVGMREGAKYLGIHLVETNVFRATYQALERMREAGYRRILFVHEPFLRSRILHYQRAAFLVTQAQWSDTEWHECIWEEAEKKVEKLRIDAFLGSYIGRARSLSEKTGIPYACMGLPVTAETEKVSGIRHDPACQARVAVDLLDSLIRNGSRGFPEIRQCVMVDSDWVDGETLGKKKKSRNGIQ